MTIENLHDVALRDADPIDETETVVLDFCAHCGVLLTENIGDDVDDNCVNCGGDVSIEDYRCVGTFPRLDAERLLVVQSE